MAKSSKVTGGFKKDWISVIRRDPGVTRQVLSTSKSILDDAETSMQLYGSLQGYNYDFYYGSAEKVGKNGATFIFWPTNAASNDDEGNATAAVKAEGLLTSEEAKNRRKKK